MKVRYVVRWTLTNSLEDYIVSNACDYIFNVHRTSAYSTYT